MRIEKFINYCKLKGFSNISIKKEYDGNKVFYFIKISYNERSFIILCNTHIDEPIISYFEEFCDEICI